jgi:ubiquinone biosynthesis protein COQ9
LQALLPIAAVEGFTRQAIDAAGKAAGLDPGMVELAAPRGPVDMLDAFAAFADDQMEANLAGVDLLSMKIRTRVRTAVAARLDALEPHKAAAKRAAHALVVPGRAQLAGAHVWRAADRIWTILGDRSTDGNYYSKRAILSGVIGSTMACWLADDSTARAATEDFLDRRIDNVMQFEKLKAQAKPLEAMAGLAVTTLARWRFGAQGDRP